MHTTLFALAVALLPAAPLAQSPESAAAAAVPPAEPAAAARVRFRAALEGDVYTVRIDGRPDLACQTPCELSIPLGPHEVQVTGSNRFAQRIDLTGPAALQVERRRMGRMVLGIVSLAVGVPVALVGLELILLANIDSREDPQLQTWTPGERRTLRSVGTGMILGGTVLGIVGGVTGFTSMGRTRIAPDPTARAAGDRPESGLRLAGLGAVPVRGGGGMVAVAFSF